MTLFNQSGKSARLVGTALLLVTFVAGALAGAATERVTRADEAKVAQPKHDRPQMRGGLSRVFNDEQFARQLELTTEQRAQIKAILDRRDAQAKRVWSEAEPRLKSLGEETKTEIKKVLTPEQVTKLESEMAKRHAMWKDRHKCHADSSAKASGQKL
jgi:Spy/CpxP family protein refolding chaperone